MTSFAEVTTSCADDLFYRIEHNSQRHDRRVPRMWCYGVFALGRDMGHVCDIGFC